jgi:hypothetical protein
LAGLLQDSTAGDPVSGLKWTHRSLRNLAKALRRRGFAVSANTVARLLREDGFSLRTCRKRLAKAHDPDRGRQFRYIARMRGLYRSRGWPVISVDTKDKVLVGNFKNPGRTWRRQARDVFDHDFPSWAAGRAIPYGIYDVGHNDGLVVVGSSHETPAFATAAVRRWWLLVGRQRYPRAKRLLVEADSGGANDYRKKAWKLGLQALADEFDLRITVTHYPTGASKWNPIDHRMFSLISMNWAGEPLVSYEAILKRIRATRSSQGFHCRAVLDRAEYPNGINRVRHTIDLRLKPRPVLGKWNYTLLPRHRATDQASYC